MRAQLPSSRLGSTLQHPASLSSVTISWRYKRSYTTALFPSSLHTTPVNRSSSSSSLPFSRAFPSFNYRAEFHTTVPHQIRGKIRKRRTPGEFTSPADQGKPEIEERRFDDAYMKRFEEELYKKDREIGLEDARDPFRYHKDTGIKERKKEEPEAVHYEEISLRKELDQMKEYAKTKIAMDSVEEAKPYLLHITKLMDDADMPITEQVETHATLGQAALQTEDLKTAKEHYHKAIKMAEDHERNNNITHQEQEELTFTLLDGRINLATLELDEGNVETTLRVLLPALKSAERCGEDLETLYMMRVKERPVDEEIDAVRHMLSRTITRAQFLVITAVERVLSKERSGQGEGEGEGGEGEGKTKKSKSRQEQQRLKTLHALSRRTLYKQYDLLYGKEEQITNREHVDFEFAKWCQQAGVFLGEQENDLQKGIQMLRMAAKWADKSIAHVLGGEYEDLMEGRISADRRQELQPTLHKIQEPFQVLNLALQQCGMMLMKQGGQGDGNNPQNIEAKRMLERAVKLVRTTSEENAADLENFIASRFRTK
eukprot:gb/GECH01011961.1/.p1 GENE.gb/GECH01011961.1/~~gb/GECH01011961.1/.p1  ORF type:complete len:543 (+),score=93.81 gb/GECH01011961.1/:1-1629(+)